MVLESEQAKQPTIRFGLRTLMKFMTAVASMMGIIGLIARKRARCWAIEGITEGMSQKEVLRVAGKPDRATHRDDNGTSHWYTTTGYQA